MKTDKPDNPWKKRRQGPLKEDSNMTATVPPPKRAMYPPPRSAPPPPRQPATGPETPVFTTSGTVAREFTFPVPSGTVILKVPFPMSEGDYSTLVQTLEIFKPGIVKSEMPSVRTSDPDWKEQAEALAESAVGFDLVGFSYAHHIQFYNQLAKKYKLESRFDPAKGTAHFRPKP